jgi:protein involved in polysaccharide export with SLBB domain
MKKLQMLFVSGAWAAVMVPAHAQMSTFPPPPPLPLQRSSPSQESSAPAGSPVTAPPPSDSAVPAKGSGASGTAPMTAATLSSMSALDDTTPLEDGDTISFRVIEDRDDPVTRIVTDTGEVDFPYIGPVKVEGKTCHQVAVEVKKLLEVDYYKQATVIVGLDLIINDDKTKQDMAWVMGEVRQVGPQELLKLQPMTVSQLVIRAGGFGDFADQRKVKLIHRLPDNAGQTPAEINNAKDFQVVDVKSVIEGNRNAADPIVQPGDYIIVPKKFVNFGG